MLYNSTEDKQANFFQNRLKSGQPRYMKKKISATVIPRAPRVSVMWLNTCFTTQQQEQLCLREQGYYDEKFCKGTYAEKFPAGWHVRPEEGIHGDGIWVT